MKGKHHKQTTRRDVIRDETTVAALEAELADEQHRLAEANRLVRVADSLVEQLHQLQRSRDRAVAGEIERLAAAVVRYEEAALREEALAKQVDEAWERFSDTAVGLGGGGTEGLEQLGKALGFLGEGSVVYGSTGQKHMNPFAVARLQRARGERRNLPDQLTSEDLLRRQVHRLRPTVVEGLVEDPSKLRVLRNLNDRVNQSSFWHGDPDTVWGWHCTDIVEVGYCDELAPLGACDAGDLDNWNGCAPARTAISREFERAALSDGSRLAQQRRWINQHQPRPLFPRPSDAVALRWWYWTAAAFQQIGAREFGSEEPLDDWDLDPLTADERLWADVSRLARAAVPYWLPPGQTYAYLGGDPLSAEDRDEIRLPYGSTMLVPSEPLRIDATGRRADADLGEALLASRIMAASRAEKSRSISSIDYRDGGVTIGDAIGAYGADIEAVVVEADQNGRRTDRILWCLAISVEDYVLGRVVVPALRSRSVWADVVDDLCATIAWGSWVDHEIDDTDSEAKKKRSSVNVEAPIVKVLDVRPPADDSGAATRTGRTIAPHTRAGHWRRQHHGPGGELVKRIRIAPTLVNASHGPLAPKVYRLPRPARAAEATS